LNQDDIDTLVNLPYEDELSGFAVHEDALNMDMMQHFSGTS
jgi:hypothetical protein